MPAEELHASPHGPARESTIISQLRKTIDANKERDAAPSSPTEEQDAPKERRRVRRLPDGTTQQLIKNADGSFDWNTISDPEANELSEEKKATEGQLNKHEDVLEHMTGSLETVERKSAEQAERISELEALVREQSKQIAALKDKLESPTPQPAQGDVDAVKKTSGDQEDRADGSDKAFNMPSRVFNMPPLNADASATEDDAKKGDNTPNTLYKGNPVSIARTHFDPNDPSKVIGVDVVDESGNVHTTTVGELGHVKAPAAVKPKTGETDDYLARGLDMHGRAPRTLDSDAGDYDEEPESIPAVNPNDQEPQGRLGKIKAFLGGEFTKAKDSEAVTKVTAWLSGERSKIQEHGGTAWFAAKWERAQQGFHTGAQRMLNWRVTETMPDDEKERIRKQNRLMFIAGSAAIIAVGISTAVGINELMDRGHGQDFPDLNGANGAIGFWPDGDPSPGDISPGASPEPTPAPGPSAEPTEPGESGEVAVVPLIGGEDVSIDPNVLPTPEINSETFNIPQDGTGGEALLKSIGVEPKEWYKIEEKLLDQFPEHFYRMDDNHVGIYAGQLPQDAQDIIKSLRQ